MRYLSPDDYQRLDGTCRLQDILGSVDSTVSQSLNARSDAKNVFKKFLERLGKFESAIDIVAQSMPQVSGFSLVGLIWGFLKVFLIVSFASRL